MRGEVTLLYVRICEVRFKFRSHLIILLFLVSCLVSMGVFWGKAMSISRRFPTQLTESS